MNKTAELLQINIVCYSIENNKFILKAVYFGCKNKNIVIPLHFINNNHFEILYPKNIKFTNLQKSFNKQNLLEFYKKIAI